MRWLLPLLLLLAFTANAQNLSFKVKKRAVPGALELPPFKTPVSLPDTTNDLLIDSLPASGAVILLWSPRLSVASYHMGVYSRDMVIQFAMCNAAQSTVINSQHAAMVNFHGRGKIPVTLTIDEIYLDGQLKKANWIYRLWVRE